MKIDLVCAGLVAFFAVLGLATGAVQQIAHLAGVVVGYFAARPLGALVGPWLAAKTGLPTMVGIIGSSLLAFFAVYVLTYFVVRLVARRALPARDRGAADRAGGFVVGAAKACAIVWVIVSGMVLLDRPLADLGLRFVLQTRKSLAGRVATRYNAFSLLGFPGVEGLARLLEAAKHPDKAQELMKDPKLQALTRDPRLQKILADESLVRALQQGDMSSLLGNPKILDLLNDASAMQQLLKAD